MIDITRSTSDLIRAKREALGVTQADVAHRMQIARHHYVEIESGRHEPTLKTLRRIAAALGMTVPELLAEPTE